MTELVMHTEKNDTVFHTEKTGMLKVVVEIDVGGGRLQKDGVRGILPCVVNLLIVKGGKEESIVETDKVNHIIETDIVKLVVEIESFGMSSNDFDKVVGSSDRLQPRQADLSCVHALSELHLHEIHVVPIVRFQQDDRSVPTSNVVDRFQLTMTTSVDPDTSSSVETDTSSSVETDTCSSVETDTSRSVETNRSSSVITDTSSSVETDTSSSVETDTRPEILETKKDTFLWSTTIFFFLYSQFFFPFFDLSSRIVPQNHSPTVGDSKSSVTLG
nr:hypothetical protein [Tanacetum cinerariifolium]